MDKVRVALIGSGPMGRDLMKHLGTIPQAVMVACADPDPEAAAQAAALGENAQAFAKAEDMLAVIRPDAVVVATPQFAHRECVEMAASAGAHIFCEKPMSTTTANCTAMIEAAKRAGVKLMIGQVLRYLPTWRTVIEIVRSGELGEPRGLAVTRIGGGFGGASRPWRASHEQSGGILMEINSHEIDFMRCLCGDVATVYCNADYIAGEQLQTPDNLYVSMRFASGAAGVLHSSMSSCIGESSGKIQCTQGTIFYGKGFGGSGLQVAKRGQEPEMREVTDPEPGVRRELREFIEAIVNDTPVPIPGEVGRANVEVAEAAYLSARTGEVVKLPLG